MSTDRELLELAAKAAGLEIAEIIEPLGGGAYAVLTDGTEWSPLHAHSVVDSMGDALRLAVKLRFDVLNSGDNLSQAFGRFGRPSVYAEWPVGDDRLAATRRAIVLAAAELGKRLT